ncbi:MAG TPA: hypothetical protein VFZ83_05860 [Acidimicrobiia bacterium]|nr:hypothetical protein [Acidimicrobiia bacterium]
MALGVFDDVGPFPVESMSCLRCGVEAPMRFAGPCPECATALRESARRDAKVVDAEYVPKTNVTANAVALKDD